jgi:hypothetical protein
VRTIWVRTHGARQQGISGNNVLGNLSWTTPLGTLTGFAYLVDQNEAPCRVSACRARPMAGDLLGPMLSKAVKLAYQASYAHQSDWRRNPNSYSADYYLADGTLDVKG